MQESSSIRVLQISYDMNLGGAETLIMNLYRNLDRSKVQFDFLLHSDKKSAYDDEITALGGKIYRIPRFLGYNKFSYDKTLRNFLLEHPEYKILHDHLMDSATETFKVAKKLGKITISHSHISYCSFSVSNFIRFFFRKNICKYADYRFACSEEAGTWLYRGKASFSVLRNGIETSKFQFSSEIRNKLRTSLGIKDNELALVHVGRFVEQKNHKRLVNIFRELVSLEKNAKLFLIGEGPLKAEVEKQVQELRLSDKIVFLGARKDVNEILSASDTFLLPSLFEGLPVSLVEAQASGLPCIFSDFMSQEVYLIPTLLNPVSLESSDKAWAEVILKAKALEHREEAYALVEKAGFDIKSTAKSLEEFYLKIVGGNLN